METIIFLANNIRNEEEDIINIITNEISDRLKLVITEYKANPGYYEILPPFDIVYVKMHFTFNGDSYSILLHKNTYDEKKNTLDITLIDNNTPNEFSENLYNIKLAVKEILKTKYREVYINHDTQNEKICTGLYSRVHRVENLFRHLINTYMVKKFGANWFHNNISEEYQSKVSQYSGWYNRKYNTFKDIQSALFNIQTDDLIKMLKTSYIDTLNRSEIDAIEQLKKKLGGKTSVVIKDEYLMLNSIWESEFSELFGNTFEEKWEDYTKMRNMIAHNKPICLELRNDILKLSEDLENLLNKKMESVKIKFSSIEEEYLRELYRDVEQELYMGEAGLNQTPDAEDVIEEISENDDYMKLISDIEEFNYSYRNLYDDLLSYLSSVKDEDLLSKGNIEVFQNKAIILYELFMELGYEKDNIKLQFIKSIKIKKELRESVTEEIYMYIDNLINENLLEDIFYRNEFVIGEIARLKDVFVGCLKIKVEGDIYPSMGESDTLDVDIFINDEKVREVHGEIERNYGDYEIHEDGGYAMPSWSDDLEVRIDKIIEYVEDFCSNASDKLQSYYERIEEIFEF